MERRYQTIPRIEAETTIKNGVVVVEGKEDGEYFHLAIGATSDISKLEDLARNIDSLNGQFPMTYREAHDVHALISASPNIQIFTTPQLSPASGETSQSRYWGWTKQNRLLIQINGRRIRSSFHGHNDIEINHQVFGETILSLSHTGKEVDVQEYKMFDQEAKILEAGTFHQVRTEKHPSLNILLCYFDKHIRPRE
ncbi:hypothetical protein HY382_01650 [Candidatus Curtissbacteria bacterium]|nr:hypothetical protein [Candidatus Curtissbacteria bacterium]